MSPPDSDTPQHAVAGLVELGSDCRRLCVCRESCPIHREGSLHLKCRGFDLPARAVIHTVGPVYYEDEADECRAELVSAYRECLHIANQEVCLRHRQLLHLWTATCVTSPACNNFSQVVVAERRMLHMILNLVVLLLAHRRA